MVDNLGHVFSNRGREVRVFEGCSFEIDPAQFVAVQGASGSGKTTLLLACGGMLAPSLGGIRFQGSDLFSLSSTPANPDEGDCDRLSFFKHWSLFRIWI